MTVQVEGIEELQKNLAKLSKKFSEQTVRAAMEVAQEIRAEAIDSIQDQSPGDVVERSRVGGGTYQHTASKEGDAPNTDTGRLVQSVQVDTRPDAIIVGSTLSYAGYLEFGTRRMGARPWLVPAVERVRPDAPEIVAKYIKTVTRAN